MGNPLSSLGADNWRTRQQALQALTQQATPELIARLVDLIRTHCNDLGTLNAAIQLLKQAGQEPLPGLLALLRSESADVRVHIPLLLANLAGPEVLPALEEALHDPDANVRFNALEALGNLGDPSIAEALVEQLQRTDNTTDERYAALTALTQLQPPAEFDQAIPTAITACLADPALGEPAALALGAWGSPADIPHLLIWLDNPANATAAGGVALVRLVSQMDTPAPVIDQIAAHLAGQPKTLERVFNAAAQLIAQPDCIDLQIEALLPLLAWLYQRHPQDPRPASLLVQLLTVPVVRHAAGQALIQGYTPDRSLPPGLRALASDQNNELATAALRVLAHIPSPETVPALLDAIQSDDEALVLLALDGLSAQPEFDRQVLQDLAQHPSPPIRQAAARMLNQAAQTGRVEQSSSPSATPQLVQQLEAEEAGQREAALRELAAQQALQPGLIRRALADPEPGVQAAAISAIPSLPGEQQGELLGAALQSTHAPTRVQATQQLANVEDPELAIPILKLASEDRDMWVRMHACRALGRYRDSRAAGLLAARLQDPIPPVRIAALEALAIVAPERLAEHWPALQADPDENVRRAAQRYSPGPIDTV